MQIVKLSYDTEIYLLFKSSNSFHYALILIKFGRSHLQKIVLFALMKAL